MAEIQDGAVRGRADGRLEPVKDVLAGLIDSGEELGASIVVDVDGQTLLDVWGGWRDEARTQPWAEDTIVNVWSTTKTVTTLAALVCVERGLLDPYEKVATYWPEFAANGKDQIEVRHLMSHTSGVSGWDQPVVTEDMYDWDASTARLAAQAPWWEPGTASGYHAFNFGHLLGEIVRRVSGKSLTEFVATEIAGPLNADFQVGADRSDWARCAEIIPPPPLPFDMASMDMQSPVFKTFTGPVAEAAAANTEGWRQAEIGAANGHGNARSVARIQSTVACGGEVDGVRLLSPKTINRIFEVQSDGIDLVLGYRLKIGVGYGLPWPEVLPFVPEGRVCFGTGAGGSMVIADADRRLTVAYVMNKMALPGPRLIVSPIAAALVERVYDIVNR
jgi:CubicO group peptidase (beta-lactamase class C family)